MKCVSEYIDMHEFYGACCHSWRWALLQCYCSICLWKCFIWKGISIGWNSKPVCISGERHHGFDLLPQWEVCIPSGFCFIPCMRDEYGYAQGCVEGTGQLSRVISFLPKEMGWATWWAAWCHYKQKYKDREMFRDNRVCHGTTMRPLDSYLREFLWWIVVHLYCSLSLQGDGSAVHGAEGRMWAPGMCLIILIINS